MTGCGWIGEWPLSLIRVEDFPSCCFQTTITSANQVSVLIFQSVSLLYSAKRRCAVQCEEDGIECIGQCRFHGASNQTCLLWLPPVMQEGL